MGTIEQLEAELQPYKLALIAAFGLDPDRTPNQLSIGIDRATFYQLHGSPQPPAPAEVRSDGSGEAFIVEYHAEHWTPEQRQAVDDYLDRFRVSSEPEATGVEIDKTGSHYEWSSSDDGQTGWAAFWDGNPPNEGDYLILSNESGSTRYKVTALNPCYNVDGMWIADVRHAPSARP